MQDMFTGTKRPEQKAARAGVKSLLKIIELMKQQPTVTIAEIAAAIGISEKGVKKQQREIKRIGLDKGEYWQVTESNTCNQLLG